MAPSNPGEGPVPSARISAKPQTTSLHAGSRLQRRSFGSSSGPRQWAVAHSNRHGGYLSTGGSAYPVVDAHPAVAPCRAPGVGCASVVRSATWRISDDVRSSRSALPLRMTPTSRWRSTSEDGSAAVKLPRQWLRAFRSLYGTTANQHASGVSFLDELQHRPCWPAPRRRHSVLVPWASRKRHG